MFAFVRFTGINKIMGEAKIMEICMKMWVGIYKEILSGHMDVVRYLVLLMVTMAAAADDYKRYKISNRIIIWGLILSAMVCIAEMYMMHVVSKNGVDITYGGYKSYKDIGLMYLSGMVWALFVSYVLYKVRAIGAGDVKLFMVVGTFIRNNSGSKYYECKVCKKNTDDKETDDKETGDTKTNSVYYTEYGTCFHSNSMCTELRRNIQKVKKSDIKDRKLCEKCSG